MSGTAVPERVDAVVIGAGALGAATAFHLAKAGLSVALIDKADLASQTSPRAAGLSGILRASDAMTRIAAHAVEKIERFTEETGEAMEYFQPGSLKVARLPEHEAQLHDEVARGKRLGLDVDLITLDAARGLMPHLHTENVRAVMHMRRDVYLEPVQIPAGYARASGRLGAHLLPNLPVKEILNEGGAVAGVRTERGVMRTPVVVDAAGAWLRKVAASGGSRVKLVPTRHQLMITVPLPGVRPDQPITRIVDANVYVRPDEGGLMLGGYESDPLQVDMDDVPADFRIEDLPLDVGVLRHLAERVAAQFPIFRDVALREHRGGLPTMTADGEHVLGPAPGVSGLYVIGGCCVGAASRPHRRSASCWRNGSSRGNRRWTSPSWRPTGSRPTCRRTRCARSAACTTRIITGHRKPSR